MCHRIIAEKVCQDCGCKMGEEVIAFEPCSRPCANPSYRLSSDLLDMVCGPCAAALNREFLSTPVEEVDLSTFPAPFSQERRKSSLSSIMTPPESDEEKGKTKRETTARAASCHPHTSHELRRRSKVKK
ncbi:hypothetical protein ACRE_009700 [Hapsidospora chrysogenum ATCC 11550]|uniref:Uncharacterized protein n=1 Tax=Hapsidospora chrysogenum (strain ATCC 11550 / CBS 779.69 / DSM 880 / IAM 14645 / JCM 23072 / IMI 49137) TaxID=857340 RepID=A0A086TFF4_HAPC1|nr:hypothetical protein ACRE_009700 [Hapsidospora chrysogenum ATCC 11550]